MSRPFLGSLAVALVLATVLAPTASGGGVEHPAVVGTNPANVTPQVVDDGVVGHTTINAFARRGSRMYAGGTFHRVTNASGSQAYTRHNLMAFDATSGAVSGFAPVVDGTVWALTRRASSLYVAGTFTSVNGVARRGVAKLDAATGAVVRRFNANLAGGRVTDMQLVGGRLVIGGTFPGRLLALNPGTGRDTGYVDLSITGKVAEREATEVFKFAAAGNRLVAIGNFTTVDDQARARAFMLSLAPAAATLNPWYYQPLANSCSSDSTTNYLRGVDFSPDGTWFALAATGYIPEFGGVGRDICDAAARFETDVATPFRPTWINYTGGDSLRAIAVTGAAVYVQGHQRWLDNPFGQDSAGFGAVTREGIGAIDPSTGRALSWNPGKTRAQGGRVLYATPAGLWVGSDGERFAGERRDNIAFLPL